MALKVELKPGEKIILGQSVITNGDSRAKFTVDGHVPILREKDVMTADQADSPSKLIYFTVQAMYLDEDIEKHYDQYFQLAADLLKAAPSMAQHIAAINNEILTGSLYKSMKQAKNLVSYEEELVSNVRSDSSGSLSTNSTERDKS